MPWPLQISLAAVLAKATLPLPGKLIYECLMVTAIILFLFFVVCVKINRYLTDVVIPLPHDD